jgi:hypothetical protein
MHSFHQCSNIMSCTTVVPIAIVNCTPVMVIPAGGSEEKSM